MPRYVAKAPKRRGWDVDEEDYDRDIPLLPDLTVYEPEGGAGAGPTFIDTGLLDASGTPILRLADAPAKVKMGFIP